MAEARFTITDVLGAGAFAVVCTGHDRELGREVALKVLRSEVRSDAGAVRRLVDEGWILQTLDHPGLVRCHGLLRYNGTPVLVLDRVQGASLSAILRYGPVPEPEAAAIASRLAAVLQHAWEATGPEGQPLRIVHRDLKPPNAMLTEDGQVVLVDFGIAKGEFAGRQARSLFLVRGSAGYDAPERAQAGDDQRVDVYGLGALLLTLVTGQAPLLRGRPGPERQAELEDALAPVGEPSLRGLLARMLAADPTRRPPMDAAAAELGELGAGADLRALAIARGVARLSSIASAAEHPTWPEIRMLQEQAPDVTRTLDSETLRERVEAFLAQPGWERRVSELEAMVPRPGDLPAEPLLAVLGRATVPWWKPWARAARPSELEAALVVLCDRSGEPAVREAARLLVEHRDGRVAAAARFLLAG